MAPDDQSDDQDHGDDAGPVLLTERFRQRAGRTDTEREIDRVREDRRARREENR